MKVRDVLRGLLGAGKGPTVDNDLPAMSTAAVMARAMSLGETLVLPSHVVFTLPRAVTQRVEEHLGRLRRAHTEPVTLVGGKLVSRRRAVRPVDDWPGSARGSAARSGSSPRPDAAADTMLTFRP